MSAVSPVPLPQTEGDRFMHQRSDRTSDKGVRHVLGLSGGKDSSALAIYMRDRIPQMEYFFCDTGAELPETYEIPQPTRGSSRQTHHAP